MRKLTVTLFALVLSLAIVGPAVAGSTTNPPPTTGGAKGRGSSTTKGRFSYPDYFGGDHTCSEVHIVHLAGNNPFIKDSFTCTIADLTNLPPGTYGGTPWDCPPSQPCFTWVSDFENPDHTYTPATTWSYTVVDNGDGTGTVTGEAYYPLPTGT